MYRLSSCCFCNGCEAIKDKKCVFTLRTFSLSDAQVTWNSNATEEDIEDWNLGPIGRTGWSSYMDICTGEGEVYRSRGGGGSCFEIYYTDADLTDQVYLYHECYSYFMYYMDSSLQWPYNGTVYDSAGTEYYVSGGIKMDPIPPDGGGDGGGDGGAAAASQAAQSFSFTAYNGGQLLGTFTQDYTDETIIWDNVDILPLDPTLDSPTSCKFKYNFSTIPSEDTASYIITEPCDQDDYSRYSPQISSQGDGYFIGFVADGVCHIYPTDAPPPDPEPDPDPQPDPDPAP